jgi:hypothetical protein
MKKEQVILLLKCMRPRPIKELDSELALNNLFTAIAYGMEKQKNHERMIYDKIIKRIEKSDNFDWIDTLKEEI